ncbi:DUF2752 domain-containing protein [Flavobacterium agri]|uniref:DUF2752 domain-containing protein n=1 Tax=Flavobacterium agri TaxID=2743471 RepID=UPI001FE95A06|nr:DUF2752 domain-containing protein [Flavobacterium agri]
MIHLTESGNHLETAQSFCPFKMLTGMPCPGCGITKSLVFLYEGDIYKSLYYHIFGLSTFVFCLGLLVLLPLELSTGKEYFNSVFYSKKIGWTLAITLIVYHFIRLCFFLANHTYDEVMLQSIWR